jgi:hypothetical protein
MLPIPISGYSSELVHPNDWSLHRLRLAQDYVFEKTGLLVSMSNLMLELQILGLVWDARGQATCTAQRRPSVHISPGAEIFILKSACYENDANITADDSGFFEDMRFDDKIDHRGLSEVADHYTMSLVAAFESDTFSLGLVAASSTVSSSTTAIHSFSNVSLSSAGSPSHDMALSTVTTPTQSATLSAASVTSSGPPSQTTAPIISMSTATSMSRRRLASRIPALSTHVNLPPPPTTSEIMGLSGPIKSPRRSPGLTISPPARLAVPIVAENIPITPIDQLMAKPEAPPQLRHGTLKQPPSFSKEFVKSWGFSIDQVAPLSSPCLVNHSSGILSVPQATLFDAPPKTPVDQVITVPSEPPALPRRRSRSGYPSVDRWSDTRGLSPGEAYITIEPTRTPRPIRQQTSNQHIPALASPQEEEENPFLTESSLDIEATPRPGVFQIQSDHIKNNLKSRPAPLFPPRKPLQELHTANIQRGISPDGTHLPTHRKGPQMSLFKLPLASPLALENTLKRLRPSPIGHPTTPLVDAQELRVDASVGRAVTPSYFSARSYFAKN